MRVIRKPGCHRNGWNTGRWRRAWAGKYKYFTCSKFWSWQLQIELARTSGGEEQLWERVLLCYDYEVSRGNVVTHQGRRSIVWLASVAGSVRRVRQGVGARTCAVQARPVCSDSDSGQYNLHSDGDERRSLPGDLSPSPAHLQTEGNDSRVVAVGTRLCHSATLHLQTGLYRPTCLQVNWINQSIFAYLIIN